MHLWKKGQIIWGVKVYPILGVSKQIYILKFPESSAVKILIKFCLNSHLAVLFNYRNFYSRNILIEELNLRNSDRTLIKHKIPQRRPEDLKSNLQTEYFQVSMEASRKGATYLFIRSPFLKKPTTNAPSAILLTKANTTRHVQLCTTNTKTSTNRPSKPSRREANLLLGKKPSCTLPTPIVFLHYRLGARAKNHSPFPF